MPFTFFSDINILNLKTVNKSSKQKRSHSKNSSDFDFWRGANIRQQLFVSRQKTGEVKKMKDVLISYQDACRLISGGFHQNGDWFCKIFVQVDSLFE